MYKKLKLACTKTISATRQHDLPGNSAQYTLKYTIVYYTASIRYVIVAFSGYRLI